MFKPDKKMGENARKKFKLNKNTFVIGFLGRLTEQKGIRKAVLSFNYLIKRFKVKNVRMVIAGEGPLKKWLVSFIENKHLNNKCLYLGYVDNQAEIYNLSDIMIMLSEFEGLPISLLEAMACGKPIISTDIREIKDVLRDCGIYVKAGSSIKDIAFTLYNVLKNRKRLNIIKRKVLLYIQEYNLTNIVNSYRELYNKIS